MSSAANPSAAAATISAAAASLPAASTTSTTPGMDSSSSHPLVSPFLAAFLSGNPPPPLVPPPISTVAVGSIASDGLPLAASVNAWPYASQLPTVPVPNQARVSSMFLPSLAPHAAPAASPRLTPTSGYDGSSSLVPHGAPASTYGAGFAGQPLFYGMPSLAYGAHSPPPAVTVPRLRRLLCPPSLATLAPSVTCHQFTWRTS
jgi:hypothetical protein